MKRLIAWVMLVAVVAALCACGKSGDNTSADKAALSVTVCAGAFSGKDDADIEAIVQDRKFEGFSNNADGSVTFAMTESAKKNALADAKDQIDTGIHSWSQDSHGDGELFTSVREVTCNEDVTEIKVVVDPETYKSWIKAYESYFCVWAAWYQALSGVEPKDVKLDIKYYNEGETEPFEVTSIDFVTRTPKSESPGEETPAPQPTESRTLKDGDAVHIDDYCDFTVVGWDNVDAITANNMKMITRDMNDADKTIVRLTLNYTNLSAEVQGVNLYAEHAREDEVLKSATLSFDGKYSYDGGSGCWSDLTPLANVELYIIFTVPRTVVEADGSIVLTFQIEDQVFTYTVR
ncbi:MAG: hypothetical protein IJV64_07560 [Oscillospiraceae bacterium]|nr:hypothetical protein [Oscillospiraceae bacterium]